MYFLTRITTKNRQNKKRNHNFTINEQKKTGGKRRIWKHLYDLYIRLVLYNIDSI